MKIIISVFAFLLAGCGTPPEVVQSVVDAQIKAAAVKTLEGECGGPCKFSFTDPRDRVQIRMPTNGWDAASSIGKSLAGSVSGSAPWAAVAEIAKAGLKNAGSNDSSVRVDNSNQGNDLSQSSVSSADNSNQGNDLSQTTTDNSNQGNATATPTVVTQPAPVIVQPQPPTIVYQPDPIIVSAP